MPSFWHWLQKALKFVADIFFPEQGLGIEMLTLFLFITTWPLISWFFV